MLGQPRFIQQTIQHFAVVDADREIIEADRFHQIKNDETRFNVTGNGSCANRVKIALSKLAITTRLGTFTSPDRRDVITLERHPKFVGVLSNKSSQRDRQVKAHSNIATAVVLKAVHLPIGLVTSFATKDIRMFQRRRVNRRKSVRPVDLSRRLHQLLTRNHGRGQKVTKSA